MITAMGPHGYEGFFRVACETTLKIIGENKNSLTCILDTFLHDPLLEWAKSLPKSPNERPIITSRASKKAKLDATINKVSINASQKNSAPAFNPEAVEHMSKINARLDGNVSKIVSYRKSSQNLSSNSSQLTYSVKLSPYGQVDFLIKEAVNVENLAQMFIGWAAYMWTYFYFFKEFIEFLSF